jgi:two-component system phosphate regulon sensor histidine kinase PhoR
MTPTISSLLGQAATYVVVGALIGALAGHPFIAATFALIIWIAVMAVQLSRLANWTRHEMDVSPPDLPGVFGEIAYLVVRYQRAQQRKQERLESALNRFQQSASSMSDAIVIVDKNDDIEWWNSAGSQLLGLIEDDRGQPVLNLFRNPEFVRYYRSKIHNDPIETRSNDNKRMLEYRIHHFGDGDRVIVARDITEVQKLEQMRRDFVANASHELRTPLTVIHGYLETLQDQELSKMMRKAVDTMYSQSSRMEALVSDLLTLSKIEAKDEASKRDLVGISSLLTQMQVEAIALSAEKQHKITLTVDPDVDVYGNAKELQSALSNLVFNAVRYTPDGGSIDIKFERYGSGAMFSVTDTGMGIASHHIPRITERFYRVDEGRSRESGGTGLGLAIVKHVLARHNSTLGISSKLGEGSRFSCIFPAERVTQNSNPS